MNALPIKRSPIKEHTGETGGSSCDKVRRIFETTSKLFEINVFNEILDTAIQ